MGAGHSQSSAINRARQASKSSRPHPNKFTPVSPPPGIFRNPRKYGFITGANTMNNWNSIRGRIFAAALLGAPAFAASNFVQHNLVADMDGVADNTDPNLLGSWGISASPASRIWVSNTSNGLATEYNTAGVGVTAAAIPPSASSKLQVRTPNRAGVERLRGRI